MEFPNKFDNFKPPEELLTQSHINVEMGFVREFDSQKISDFKPLMNFF